MHLLRQSTTATVLVGPVLDSAGAAVTSAVVGDFRLAKEGSTGVLSGATVTHDANGYYRIALTVGNTDTVGRLAIYSNNTAQSMGTTRFMVLLPSVYDALVANATNTTGGLPAATGTISALAGAISTYAGGAVASVTGAVGSVTSPVTVGTNNDKTNYGLSTTALTDVANAVWTAATRTLTGFGSLVSDVANAVWSAGTRTLTAFGFGVTVTTNNDKTGYSLTQQFPANFALLGIDGSGAILNVSTVEELGVNALQANGLQGEIALAVWSEPSGATYTDGSFGDRILISQNNTRTLAVTGAGHIAAVLHDAEPNSIPEDAFVTAAISARALAADAATEISTAVGQLTPLVDLGTMIINDGTANARYSVSALQNAPSGGGGGSVINVYPVSASTPERVAGTTLTFYRDENRSVSVVTDFVLDSLELEFVVEDSEGTDIQVIADGSIARSDKTFTVTIGTTVTATISNYRWALRDVTGSGNSVIARGVLSVQEAASNG